MKLKRFLQKKLSYRLYEKIKNHFQNFSQSIATKSIKQAVCEQGLSYLAYKLTEIVPDITHQYSTFKLNTLYLTKKSRGQHAF